MGTAATVKGVWPDQLREMGYACVLGNTYHLYLRPGHERIRGLGGLHRFMGWDRLILTDSGGFQVFSLSALRKVSDEAVTFRSHLDGSKQFLSPERATEVQLALGADVAMVLDHVIALPAEDEAIEDACLRSIRWAARWQASSVSRYSAGERSRARAAWVCVSPAACLADNTSAPSGTAPGVNSTACMTASVPDI